jgi:hypothetical protein
MRPSTTSVASDSGLTRQTTHKAKPHLQPRWRHNAEAETSVPQPPPVRECSVLHSLCTHAAPFTVRSLAFPAPCQPALIPMVAVLRVSPHLMIIVPVDSGNNFFVDFTLFRAISHCGHPRPNPRNLPGPIIYMLHRERTDVTTPRKRIRHPRSRTVCAP